MADFHKLRRFVQAQDPVYRQVCAERAERAAGEKTSHWMWFIFPQFQALGRSATARYFGIASRGQAEAYRLHPVLGSRLKACTALVLTIGPTER